MPRSASARQPRGDRREPRDPTTPPLRFCLTHSSHGAYRRAVPAGVWLLAFALGYAMPALAADVQVNGFTTSSQRVSSVAVGGNGNFVVAWTSDNPAQDGSNEAAVVRRVDASGVPLGGDIVANTYTTGAQYGTQVAADGTGNFVVVWNSFGQDGDTGGVFARRFDGGGLPLGSEFQVNVVTTGFQSSPSMAMAAGGGFVIVWDDLYRIVGRRYDGAGAPLGGEFQVNTTTTGFRSNAAAAMTPGGSFVVVWIDGGSGGDVLGQRFDAAGLPIGGEFQVNTTMTNLMYPRVAIDAAGNFVVVWMSVQQEGGIIARRLDASGVPLGGEFQVTTVTSGIEFEPDVAMNPAGDFLVVWRNATPDIHRVLGQRFDATGTRQGGEFQLGENAGVSPFSPAVAMDADGDFLAAWSDFDASAHGVFAHLNKPDRILLGNRLSLRQASSGEPGRAATVTAAEVDTDIGRSIDGDPTVEGATLRFIANGGTATDQTYVLDSAGWIRRGPQSFRYQGPTGGDGDPVHRVILRRTRAGKAFLKVVLNGRVGTQSLDAVPPNPGDDGGIILQIGAFGGTYCASFGGAAGGDEQADDASRWRIKTPTAEAGCPSP